MALATGMLHAYVRPESRLFGIGLKRSMPKGEKLTSAVMQSRFDGKNLRCHKLYHLVSIGNVLFGYSLATSEFMTLENYQRCSLGFCRFYKVEANTPKQSPDRSYSLPTTNRSLDYILTDCFRDCITGLSEYEYSLNVDRCRDFLRLKRPL